MIVEKLVKEMQSHVNNLGLSKLDDVYPAKHDALFGFEADIPLQELVNRESTMPDGIVLRGQAGHDAYDRVKSAVEARAAELIRQRVRATLYRNNATGDFFVELVTPTEAHPELEKVRALLKPFKVSVI